MTVSKVAPSDTSVMAPHATSTRAPRPAAATRAWAAAQRAGSGSIASQRPACARASSTVFVPMPAPTSNTPPRIHGASIRGQYTFQFTPPANRPSSPSGPIASAIPGIHPRDRVREEAPVADGEEAQAVPIREDEEGDDRRDRHDLCAEDDRDANPAEPRPDSPAPREDYYGQEEEQREAHREAREEDADAGDVAEHGDGRQAMHHQGDEVHRRAARETMTARRRHRDERDARLEDGGRIMRPRLGHDDERREVLVRHRAEVADPDRHTGERAGETPVERVADAEQQSLGPAGALSEDDLGPARRAQGLDQAGHVLRAVLAVAVHHDDGVEGAFGAQVREPDRDGALMPEVAREAEDVDRAERAERARERRRRSGPGRGVVDDQHGGRQAG